MTILDTSAKVLDSVAIATEEVLAFTDELYGYNQCDAEIAMGAYNVMVLVQSQIADVRQKILRRSQR